MRWDLIDQFEVLKKGSFSRAVKSFSGHEDFFMEHYDVWPLVPQTLCIEMIAQAGGVLVGLGLDFKKEVILAKIDSAEFGPTISPPCQLQIEARIEEEREEGAWVSGKVNLGKDLIVKAKILLVTVDSLTDAKRTQVVFNDHFLKHYDVYRIAAVSEGIS